jgi:hypothetical protein
MFAKYINSMNGKTFVVNENAKKYLDDNSAMKFIGDCTEDGTIIPKIQSSKQVYLDDETRKIVDETIPKAKPTKADKAKKKVEEDVVSEFDDEA